MQHIEFIPRSVQVSSDVNLLQYKYRLLFDCDKNIQHPLDFEFFQENYNDFIPITDYDAFKFIDATVPTPANSPESGECIIL